jgi:hypothetical protein
MDATNFITKADLDSSLSKMEDRLESRIEKLMIRVVAAGMKQAVADMAEVFSEDKLDRTSAIGDLHGVDIRQLKRKTGLA